MLLINFLSIIIIKHLYVFVYNKINIYITTNYFFLFIQIELFLKYKILQRENI